MTEQQRSGIIGNSDHTLVAQLVKSLPAVRETQVRSLGWEDALEKEMATHSSILAWKIPWTGTIVRGIAKSWTRLSGFTRSYKYTTLSLHSTRCLNEYLVGKSWENVRCVEGEYLN